MNGDLPLGFTITGTIHSVQGNSITARLPQGSVGDLCWISTRENRSIAGQIIAFQDEYFSIALFEEPQGVYPGATIRTQGLSLSIPIGQNLLGAVIDPLGRALSGDYVVATDQTRSIYAKPPPASGRPPIETLLHTGIRSIDAFCSLGYGQRIGVFASAGVGKSTLLASIARQADVDVIVVALVGERGREVQEFIDDILGADGMKRSVLVVATSDDSSLLRQTAPYTATTIAEFFRDQGKNVLLIVDSLTRMARAVRETSIGAGDLPVRHGYTNSVYTQLPRLVERAGRAQTGSITAIYTVLTNQEDDIDPLADEIKSLLDGHICLSTEMIELGVRPAIDITKSVSRLYTKLHTSEFMRCTKTISRAVSRILNDRQIVLLGGTPDAELQLALDMQPQIFAHLSQNIADTCCWEVTREKTIKLAEVLQSA